MKATDDDLREVLGLDRRRSAAERQGCPSAEDIVTHAEGAGDPAAHARVLEHVAQCPHCAFEQRLASSLKPWADGAAFAWSPPASPGARVRLRAAWWPAALAASLLVGAGLAGWNLTLQQRGLDLQAQLTAAQSREQDATRGRAEADAALAVARAPVTNVPIVDLEASGARGAGGIPALLRVAPGAKWATFVLAVAGGAGAEAHSLEIRSEDGRVVWRGDGLVANRFGTFTVAVPQALLAPGRYQFVLSRSESSGRKHLVHAYALVVTTSEP